MLFWLILIGVVLRMTKAFSSGRGGQYLAKRYAHKALSRGMRRF